MPRHHTAREDGGGVVGCVGQSSELRCQRNKLSLQRTEQNKCAAHDTAREDGDDVVGCIVKRGKLHRSVLDTCA
jgi:hypothetical protein